VEHARSRAPAQRIRQRLGQGKIISVARPVIDGDWAGIFSMATLQKARGMGAGRTVLSLLADWAGAHAAAGIYLQVEIDNDPALQLYNTSNFIELRRYHYRQRASPQEDRLVRGHAAAYSQRSGGLFAVADVHERRLGNRCRLRQSMT
jgi:ribosomal protein S18 acetylase RimI-like enzyme